MSLGCTNYLLSKIDKHPAEDYFPQVEYDVFISAYNTSHRVSEAFDKVRSKRKVWIVLPEYGINPDDLKGEVFTGSGESEGEVIGDIVEDLKIEPSLRICIDSTGFLRPHLLFLLAWFYRNQIKKFSVLYTTPIKYKKDEDTVFSRGESPSEVRQILGYEGEHTSEANKEFLIVGCGYDEKRVIEVNKDKSRSRKVRMFAFPPLRPHMYQESRVRMKAADDSFGDIYDTIFSPAQDPFATADALTRFYKSNKSKISDLYLCPLATKAQVVGFSIFYLSECIEKPVSIIYPFVHSYNPDTSDGVANFWEYHINFDLYST